MASLSKVRVISLPENATHTGTSYFVPEHRLDDIVRGYNELVYPNPTNPNTSTLQFEFTGERSSVVDLRSIHLKLQFKMLTLDGDEIEEEAETKIVNGCYANNILHTLFSNYELSLQGKVIATANNMYPQKAFMEIELSQPMVSKESILKCHGYSFEEDPADTKNDPAFASRRQQVVNSGLVNLYGQLAVDFFGTGNFLLPDIEARLTLTRASDSFAAISVDSTKGQYKIVITKAMLYIHKLSLQPMVMTSIYRALQRQPARYNFMEMIPKSYIISTHHNEFVVEDIFEGASIRRMIFGFIKNNAYTGSAGLNPLKFINPGIKSVRIIRDGEPVGCTPLFFDDGLVRAYTNTLLALNVQELGNGITLSNFKNHFMLAFAFTSDLQTKDDAIRPELVGGKIRLELQFDDGAIDDTTRLVVFGEKRAAVYIDKDKNVYRD